MGDSRRDEWSQENSRASIHRRHQPQDHAGERFAALCIGHLVHGAISSLYFEWAGPCGRDARSSIVCGVELYAIPPAASLRCWRTRFWPTTSGRQPWSGEAFCPVGALGAIPRPRARRTPWRRYASRIPCRSVPLPPTFDCLRNASRSVPDADTPSPRERTMQGAARAPMSSVGLWRMKKGTAPRPPLCIWKAYGMPRYSHGLASVALPRAKEAPKPFRGHTSAIAVQCRSHGVDTAICPHLVNSVSNLACRQRCGSFGPISTVATVRVPCRQRNDSWREAIRENGKMSRRRVLHRYCRRTYAFACRRVARRYDARSASCYFVTCRLAVAALSSRQNPGSCRARPDEAWLGRWRGRPKRANRPREPCSRCRF
jgi:hypothetical protein